MSSPLDAYCSPISRHTRRSLWIHLLMEEVELVVKRHQSNCIIPVWELLLTSLHDRSSNRSYLLSQM